MSISKIRNIALVAVMAGCLASWCYAEENASRASGQAFSSGTAESVQNELDYLLFTSPYGFADSTVAIHAFLATEFLNYEPQALGDYADEGGDEAGHFLMAPARAYVNISSIITKELKAVVEFEMEDVNEVKLTKLLGIWYPDPLISLRIGHGFSILGIKEKVYYPMSTYRLFANTQFLAFPLKRDTGLFAQCEIPLAVLSPDGKITLDVSLTNGPQLPDSFNFTPDANGYMFENFPEKVGQALDNNNNKPVAAKVSIAPMKGCEFGASYLEGKWDSEDRHLAQFMLGHFLVDMNNLVLIAEYTQLKFWTPLDTTVTQFDGYVAAGYTLLKDQPYVRLLQPVVRYELFDSWKEDSEHKGYRQSVSAGLRYSPLKGWIINTAYQVTMEPYLDKDKQLHNNGFIGEAAFEF